MNPPYVKVVARPGTPDAYQVKARRWAIHFDAAHSGNTGDGIYTVPALMDYPGYVVRHFGDRIYVHVNHVPDVVEEPELEPIPTQAYKTLVHGAVRNYYLGRGDPVSTFDPLASPRFAETDHNQISLSASGHEGTPLGWSPPVGENGAKFSHLNNLRPTLYSGWMRAVVQSVLGIGYGEEDIELRDEYELVKHRFTWPVSDGVVFTTPLNTYQGSGTFAQNMKPVVVRVDAKKRRILIGDLQYWDSAYNQFGGDDVWPDEQSWGDYLAYMEAQGLDPLARLIVETFWGLPSGTSTIDAETTAETVGYSSAAERAIHQRVRSGALTELHLGYNVNGSPICDSHGWAFSYSQQQASHVVTYYDSGTQWPKGALYTLSFSIGPTELPPPPTVPAALAQYMAYWVENEYLDSMAVGQWKLRLPQRDIDRFASRVVTDAAGNATEGALQNRALAQDIENTQVPVPRYSASVRVNKEVEGWIDNPVGNTPEAIPAVHVKVPEYNAFYGNITWRMPPPEGQDTPPRSGFAPISCFYTREGGMILTQLISTWRDEREPDTAGEVPECEVDSYTSVTNTYLGGDRYRDVGLNVKQEFDNLEIAQQDTTKWEYTFLYNSYSTGDNPIYPAEGIGRFHKNFLGKAEYTTRTFSERRASAVFPMYEREGVHLGYPTNGPHGGWNIVGYSAKTITDPHLAYYQRCFPGYPAWDYRYFECTSHQSCPFVNAGQYPRIVLDPGVWSDTACAAWWSGVPWSAQCTDMDALYNATKDLTTYIPPGDTVWVPAEYKAEVYLAHTDLPGGILQVKEEEGPEASISGWWRSVSPTLDGAVPYVGAAGNAIGQSLVIAHDDMDGKAVRIGGLAKTEPFASMEARAVVFVGHALPES